MFNEVDRVRRVTLALEKLCHRVSPCLFFLKGSSVICVESSSQLKVTHCLQIKPRSFGRTGWPKSLRSEGKKTHHTEELLQSCVCVNNAHLCVRENVPAKSLAAAFGPVSHVWVFEDPVVWVEYCVSILFISLLYKHQQGEGAYCYRGKGHRAMKYSQGTQS